MIVLYFSEERFQMLRKIFFFLCLLVFANKPYAQNKPEIFALKLEGLCHEDGSGKYDKIMKDLGYTYKVYPAIRSRQFMLNRNACLFPVDMQHLKMTKSLIQSAPLVKIDIKIYSLNKKYSIADLNQLRVGIRHGLMYGPKVDELQKKWKVESVNSLEQNILKLKSGRIDAMIEFELDVSEYVQKNPESIQLVEGSEKLDSLSDSLVCVKNKINEEFIKKFNADLASNRKKIDQMLQGRVAVNDENFIATND